MTLLVRSAESTAAAAPPPTRCSPARATTRWGIDTITGGSGNDLFAYGTAKNRENRRHHPDQCAHLPSRTRWTISTMSLTGAGRSAHSTMPATAKRVCTDSLRSAVFSAARTRSISR